MKASHFANALPETYDIAPTGDMILVVGEEETELRVHSECMKNASRVFNAMFGPCFSEGQPSNGDLPKKIPLPDDDATAMTIICIVIHHRNDLMPDVLEPEDSIETLWTADKYDCVLALRHAICQRLHFKKHNTPFPLGSLLIFAYASNDSDAFRRISQKLITGTSQPYYLLIDNELGALFGIPSSIYDSLSESRTRIRNSIQDVLHPQMARCCCNPSDKGHNQKMVHDQMQVLLDNNMWGASLFEVPIDDVVAKAEKLAHLTSHTEDEKPCKHTRNKERSKETRYSTLKRLAAPVGLCLRCVRKDPNFPCDLDH